MAKVGIRELKNSLSKYVKRAAAGERIQVTDHGAVVAELIKPVRYSDHPGAERYNKLVAEGVISPATDPSPLLKGIRGFRLPRGTALELHNENRKDFDEP